MKLTETPDLRWFENTDRKCNQCGKRASGLLRDFRNVNYGPHCEPCANKRLKASARVRAALEAHTSKGAE